MAKLKTKAARMIVAKIKNAAMAKTGLFPDYAIFGISEVSIETKPLPGKTWILSIEARNRTGATARITCFLDGAPLEWEPGPMDRQTLVVKQRPDEPITTPEPLEDVRIATGPGLFEKSIPPKVDGNGETPDSCKGEN